jgi:hypothetical protein
MEVASLRNCTNMPAECKPYDHSPGFKSPFAAAGHRPYERLPMLEGKGRPPTPNSNASVHTMGVPAREEAGAAVGRIPVREDDALGAAVMPRIVVLRII